ncbi:DUF4382 domain-containing protein [Marinobacter pelagius]|uniref:DUF4382 domain-containing protein n=1 Tax=Marinobacter pelagius TaxID=379482 RepID=A0A1I4RDS2_9GAMM|nr:DUF4382 domain-containing protein [Marinobacter pelagius]SFM50357.1 protein of unknown function [Marinobacter pelagius]
MSFSRIQAAWLALLIGPAVALTGCGGSSSDSSSTTTAESTSPQGSVAMFVTDAPADPDLFEAVYVTLSQVELVPEDGSQPIVVREGDPVTVDLLNLTHDSLPLSYREGIPEGRYCEIRLTVDEVKLDLADGETVTTGLPADGLVTLLPDDCLDVQTGGVVNVQLDIDLGKSIFEEDGAYFMRPVFYVDVIREPGSQRLVRLEGKISEFDQDQQRILLCDSLPVQRYDFDNTYQGCAWVDLTDSTALFDNLNYDGEPRALSELFMDAKLGQTLAVAGVVSEFGHGVLEFDIPAGQLPPPGECKLWYPERPAGQQPPPKPCDLLVETAPTDTVVIDHDARIILDRRGLMAVDAIALELGEFLRVDGSVVDPVTDGAFTMASRPGEAVQADAADPLPVALQATAAGVNGTRIVSKTGAYLGTDAVIPETPVSVDGILETSSVGNTLRAALVVLDEAMQGLERLSGTVQTVDGSTAIVTTAIADDNPCGDSAGDLQIVTDAETRFLTVTVTDSGSTSRDGGTLEADQTVDVYGVCATDGTFDAEQVVIIEDTRAF